MILIEISKRGDYALLIETEFVEEENKIKVFYAHTRYWLPGDNLAGYRSNLKCTIE